jgi:hypothetical protein
MLSCLDISLSVEKFPMNICSLFVHLLMYTLFSVVGSNNIFQNHIYNNITIDYINCNIFFIKKNNKLVLPI